MKTKKISRRRYRRGPSFRSKAKAKTHAKRYRAQGPKNRARVVKNRAGGYTVWKNPYKGAPCKWSNLWQSRIGRKYRKPRGTLKTKPRPLLSKKELAAWEESRGD